MCVCRQTNGLEEQKESEGRNRPGWSSCSRTPQRMEKGVLSVVSLTPSFKIGVLFLGPWSGPGRPSSLQKVAWPGVSWGESFSFKVVKKKSESVQRGVSPQELGTSFSAFRGPSQQPSVASHLQIKLCVCPFLS